MQVGSTYHVHDPCTLRKQGPHASAHAVHSCGCSRPAVPTQGRPGAPAASGKATGAARKHEGEGQGSAKRQRRYE